MSILIEGILPAIEPYRTEPLLLDDGAPYGWRTDILSIPEDRLELMYFVATDLRSSKPTNLHVAVNRDFELFRRSEAFRRSLGTQIGRQLYPAFPTEAIAYETHGDIWIAPPRQRRHVITYTPIGSREDPSLLYDDDPLILELRPIQAPPKR